MTNTVDVGGATLLVEDRGADRGCPALVFLHYWGGSAATWRKVVARLDQETRCVALNQRGWSGSKATDGRYDLAAMAGDVKAVVARLGLGRFVLVGHSMGGKVAQILAKGGLPGLAGLVLVAPGPPTPMSVPEEVREAMLQSYQSAEGVEQALKNLAGPKLPDAERAGVIADTLAGEPGAKREWTEHGMVEDLGLASGDIAVPVTVPVGSLDQVEKPERLRSIFSALVPQARFVEVEGFGHLLPLEAPEPIADACRDLIAASASS
jgi:pimeloyl-ACP methyl ester carboxylesterase